jgi:hypothetical protein
MELKHIILATLPIILVIIGSIPILLPNHKHRLNLSAWTVIVCNAWLAALGTLFSEKSGFGAAYLSLNALILTPILLLNIKKGVWGNLPVWQKLAAPILPIGALLGMLMGGEYATWAACGVSLLLIAQLTESVWKGLVSESPTTWMIFLVSDSLALGMGWSGANIAYRFLLSIWVTQCLLVLISTLIPKKKKPKLNTSKFQTA